MSQNLNATYYLCADIDVGSGWTPIGTKNNPFAGKLEGRVNPSTNTYFKIKNLNTSGSTYAGLFGYTKAATIKNIIVENATVSGEYAGAIVGYANGGTYSNYTIKNSTITATKHAGGVVGYLSSGIVSGITVTATSSKEIKLNSSISNGSVGGVVGYSAGTIGSNNAGDIEVTGSVVINGSASDKSIYVGGVAGYSSGTVKNAYVDPSEVKTSSTAKGYVGGVVGYSTGLVSGSYVSTSVSGNTSKADSYTGGIVGFDRGSAVLTISRCGVIDANIKGYYVGGIVGSLSSTQTITLAWKSSYYDKGYHKSRYLDSYSYTINVSECAVEDSVTVQGIYAGGLAGIISNGVISDCYTIANVTGISGGKVKAGFAATIQSSGMKNLGGTGSAGIVTHCYSACTFGSSNGTSYAITSSDVHLYYKVDNGRSAGYVFDYLYDTNKSGSAKDPSFSGWTNNDSDKSTSDLCKASTYTSFGFNSTYWNLFDGQYISLKNISYPF